MQEKLQKESKAAFVSRQLEAAGGLRSPSAFLRMSKGSRQAIGKIKAPDPAAAMAEATATGLPHLWDFPLATTAPILTAIAATSRAQNKSDTASKKISK